MQIACKYRSLSRYRSKRNLSLYIPFSRYVFFSHSHCTCPFPTLCFSLPFPAVGQRENSEEKKSKPGQSKRGRDRDGIFFVRSFSTPSSKSSAAPSPLLIFSFLTRPDTGEFTRYRRVSMAFEICRRKEKYKIRTLKACLWHLHGCVFSRKYLL